MLLVYRWYPDGGIENYLTQLIDETAGKVDYTIASLTTSVKSDLQCHKIGPILSSGRIEDMYLNSRKIRVIMSSGEYDAVHIQTNNGSAFYLANIAKLARIPQRIVHSHNAGYESVNLIKIAVGNISKKIWSHTATDLWACSEKAGKFTFGKKKYQVFNNGIDINKFAFSNKKRIRIRSELGVGEDTFLLGSMGRISEQKNPIFQLRVFSELLKLFPNAKFCMIGSGDMENDRDAEAQRLYLGDSLIKIARTAEPDAFYSAFDALLFPSLFEGFGFVGIEGQAEGLPVYASDVLPEELAITDYISFNSIDEDPSIWAKRIADNAGRFLLSDRAGFENVVREAGFDKKDCFDAVVNAYKQVPILPD